MTHNRHNATRRSKSKRKIDIKDVVISLINFFVCIEFLIFVFWYAIFKSVVKVQNNLTSGEYLIALLIPAGFLTITAILWIRKPEYWTREDLE